MVPLSREDVQRIIENEFRNLVLEITDQGAGQKKITIYYNSKVVTTAFIDTK